MYIYIYIEYMYRLYKGEMKGLNQFSYGNQRSEQSYTSHPSRRPLKYRV